jgi:hypothetical protein
MTKLWKIGGSALLVVSLSACAGKKIVTVTFPQKDGNSEYWVCDRTASECRGKGEGDVDPMNYKPGLETLSPPVQCPHGAAKMEIVVKGNEVLQVGYECAQPSVPTGLPRTPPATPGQHTMSSTGRTD